MQPTARNTTVLVLGGTGTTGKRVADRLKERGVAVRIGSRSATPPFDWDAPGTWPTALEGVSSVYIAFYPDLTAPGAPEAIAAFSKLAVERGVGHLVLLSGRGEDEAQRCEEMVRRAGTKWTIVRASWFNQNFSEKFLIDAVRSGEVALPAGPVGEPFIDVDDIADVAVAALTEGERHYDQVYEVTGPRLLTFAEAVAIIGQSVNREIAYVQVPAADYAAEMVRLGVPKEFADMVTYLFTEVLDGRNAHTSDGVQRALGRPARDFADYARAAAATGVWNPQA